MRAPHIIIASNHEAGTIAGMLYRATAPGTRLTPTNGTAIPQDHRPRQTSLRFVCEILKIAQTETEEAMEENRPDCVGCFESS